MIEKKSTLLHYTFVMTCYSLMQLLAVISKQLLQIGQCGRGRGHTLHVHGYITVQIGPSLFQEQLIHSEMECVVCMCVCVFEREMGQRVVGGERKEGGREEEKERERERE